MSKSCLLVIAGLILIFSCTGNNETIKQENINEAFMKAILNEDLKEMKRLIKAGVDVNERNDQGLSPIMFALIMEKNADIIKMLLKNGVNINEEINSEDGCTKSILKFAIIKGMTDIAKILIEEGADVNMKGGKGGTPLMVAICKGNTDIVKLLIEYGADVNGKVSGRGYYKTPLEKAKNNEEIRQILIGAGAVE